MLFRSLNKNIATLSKLRSLKSLHLENDNLRALPLNIKRLGHLETLYLNNNHFKRVPIQIKGLKNLKYLEFEHNDLKPNFNLAEKDGFGFKIHF